MKKKLALDDLKIESFATSMKETEKETVKGGGGTWQAHCGTTTAASPGTIEIAGGLTIIGIVLTVGANIKVRVDLANYNYEAEHGFGEFEDGEVKPPEYWHARSIGVVCPNKKF